MLTQSTGLARPTSCASTTPTSKSSASWAPSAEMGCIYTCPWQVRACAHEHAHKNKEKRALSVHNGWCAGPQMGRERDWGGGGRGGGRVWSGEAVGVYMPVLSLAVNPFGHTHIHPHPHTHRQTHTHTHTGTDCEGNVIGGHLLYANVFTTAEILLGVLPHNALSRYTSSSSSSTLQHTAFSRYTHPPSFPPSYPPTLPPSPLPTHPPSLPFTHPPTLPPSCRPS